MKTYPLAPTGPGQFTIGTGAPGYVPGYGDPLPPAAPDPLILIQPEPGAFGLLVMGGLALLRRRQQA